MIFCFAELCFVPFFSYPVYYRMKWIFPQVGNYYNQSTMLIMYQQDHMMEMR